MQQFERELAGGWEYDQDPVADHPFGSYYHWCALLCGFSDLRDDKRVKPHDLVADQRHIRL